MNKRQEIAAWIFAVLLMAILADSGEGAFVEKVLPALILATMTIFSLRTRVGANDGKLLAGAAITLALIGAGAAWRAQQNRRIENAQAAADEAQSDAADAQADADDARTRLDQLEARTRFR